MSLSNKNSILEIKKNNYSNKILNIIRYNENISRNEIKKITSYSMTTVLNVVDSLLSQGLIYEEESNESKVGRRPIWLHLNPEGGYFIGIEFNSRKMHCNILNFLGDTIYSIDKDMMNCKTREQIIERILKNICLCEDFLGEKKKKKILGVGIGVPGYVDSEKGIAKSYQYFENWENVKLKEIIEKNINYPVYIENNVNVMGFAYKWLFFNGYCEDFVFLSIRTGARMVSVINNQIICSTNGYAGEIGHVKISSSHMICTCGKFGCLNSEISDFSIVEKIKAGIKIGRFKYIYNLAEGNLDSITVDKFVEAVLSEDSDSIELLNNITHYLSIAIAFIVNILAPKRIILFGELSKIGKKFTDQLKIKLKSLVLEDYLNNLKIESSCAGDDLGAIGAASLVMQKQFSFVGYPN